MDTRHQKIVAALLASYEMGGINNIDGSDLPSKTSIGELCEDFLRLLFPGFFSSEGAADEVEVITSERVATITERLCEEVTRSLRFGVREDGTEHHPNASRDACCELMGALPQVRALLRTDVEAAYEGDPAARSYEEIILSYPCLEAIAIQRVAHVLYQQKVPLIPRMMTEWAHARTGIDIHPGASIGTHFFIDHGTGVVIGETCVIGNQVKLYHGVTLGARSFAKDDEGRIVKGTKRHPDVEDGATIYPNATILGGRTVIGARSTIGANVFLMSSVNPDTLVALEEGEYRILDKTQKPSPPTQAALGK